mmetsp:Transcript_36516/g.72731  ORF Transcript_36516/g.72731 Transcript_36516/m.72731 type:complete len:361 (-) Transcript_36516:1523-2605(-)
MRECAVRAPHNAQWRARGMAMQSTHLGVPREFAPCSSGHIGGDVNRLGELGDGDLETRLHLLEYLGVVVARGEGDGEALRAETARAADAVEVGVGRVGHVVVDDDVDTLDVDAAAPDVRRDEDAVLEVLEVLVHLDALLLLHRSVDGHRGEVALLQQLVELDSTLHRLDENNHLVEFERVKQLVELAVLLVLLQLDVVLLEAVQRQLGVVDVDLHRVLHELFADAAHLLGERRREHHHLFLVRCGLEDLLHVPAHVERLEHLVALVKDEVLDGGGLELLLAHQLQHASGCAHDDVGALGLEDALVLIDGHAAEEDFGLHVGQVAREALKLVADLVGELAGVAEDEGTDGLLLDVELMQRR